VPKPLTPEQLAARMLNATGVKIAIRVMTDEPMYLCSGISSFVIGTDVFRPWPIKIDEVETTGLDIAQCRVQISDTRSGDISRMVYANGVAGTEVTIWVSVEDEMGHYTEPVQIFDGRVATVNLDDSALLKFQVTGRVGMKWRSCLHEASRACTSIFKGRLCGYTGAEEWCDGSFERCQDLSNEARFRGFRFAPNSGDTIDLGTPITVPDEKPYQPSPNGPVDKSEWWSLWKRQRRPKS